MGQVRVVRIAVEGELEDPHAGQMELIAQRGHVGRDQPQVLGDERQGAEALLDGLEELGARASAPIGPLCAVDAPAGTCQAAAKARK